MAQRVLVVDDSATLRRLLCAVLRGGGYEVETAADGAEGLERVQGGAFDLMLVDFVMPRLNGYQLTQAVRSIPSMRSMPVVLVSARTQQIGERFMAQTGAVATLEKPFTPTTLLSTVARALGDRHSLPPGALDDATTEDLLETGPGYRDPARAPIVPEVDDDIPRTSRVTLAPPYLTRSAHPDVAVREEDFALEGRLGLIPLGEVFQLLALQAQTGLLVVRQGVGQRGRQTDAEVIVAFRHGKIDQAIGRRLGDAWRIGRFLVTAGAITRGELEAASGPSGRVGLFGSRLVAEGHIDTEQLDRALRAQTCELVYEVLRWTTGRFHFDVGATLPAADLVRMELSGDTLVLEGTRRIDEWRAMEPELASERAVFSRNEVLVSAMATDRLERDERRILEAIDGQRTVRELVAALDIGAFEVCRIVHRLSRARLVTADPT